MKNYKSKPILYVDMDEVLVNFCSHPSLKLWDRTQQNPPEMYEPGFFESLRPLPGAISSVTRLINENEWDIYILTQPVAKSPVSYMEKANWICKWLPDLRDKIILTQNKSLNIGDVLVDDNEKWGKVFAGKFILFKRNMPSVIMWSHVLRELKTFMYCHKKYIKQGRSK